MRQGDRVRLLAAHQGSAELHEAGKTGTVLTTHVKPGSVTHDVALDFGEIIQASPSRFELAAQEPATVTFAPDGRPHISFG